MLDIAKSEKPNILAPGQDFGVWIAVHPRSVAMSHGGSPTSAGMPTGHGFEPYRAAGLIPGRVATEQAFAVVTAHCPPNCRMLQTIEATEDWPK